MTGSTRVEETVSGIETILDIGNGIWIVIYIGLDHIE